MNIAVSQRAPTTVHGEMAFHCAAVGGHVAAMEFLLAHGADPLAKDEHGAAMELLLAHGADPNAKDESGMTAFHYVAENGHVAAMEFLLAHGADPLAKDVHGEMAFNYAAKCGHMAALKLLLEHGADLNAKDENGNTALNFAVKYGECPTAVVLALFAAGADRTAKNEAGQTAFEVADWHIYKLTRIAEAFDFAAAHNMPHLVFVSVLCAVRRRPSGRRARGGQERGGGGARVRAAEAARPRGQPAEEHRRVRGGADARNAPRHALQGHHEHPVSVPLKGRATTHVPTPLVPE